MRIFSALTILKKCSEIVQKEIQICEDYPSSLSNIWTIANYFKLSCYDFLKPFTKKKMLQQKKKVTFHVKSSLHPSFVFTKKKKSEKVIFCWNSCQKLRHKFSSPFVRQLTLNMLRTFCFRQSKEKINIFLGWSEILLFLGWRCKLGFLGISFTILSADEISLVLKEH